MKPASVRSSRSRLLLLAAAFGVSYGTMIDVGVIGGEMLDALFRWRTKLLVRSCPATQWRCARVDAARAPRRYPRKWRSWA